MALRRGLDPAADALREVFEELLADEQPLRRIGAFIAGTDIRYPMPGADQHALAGTFAPDLTLHTDQGTTSVAELMRTARPVLLDLADRADLRETARAWRHRVDIHTAKTDDRPADALLIRPDACIVWAANHRRSLARGSPCYLVRSALRSGYFTRSAGTAKVLQALFSPMLKPFWIQKPWLVARPWVRSSSGVSADSPKLLLDCSLNSPMPVGQRVGLLDRLAEDAGEAGGLQLVAA